MARKVVSLYIDDASLRLLVAGDGQVKRWAELPLEPGLVRDGVVVDEAAVADKIKELVAAGEVKAKKVIVGLSGLGCLFRIVTLPELPKAILAEAIKREAERALPVPLEQLYLSWQVIPGLRGEVKVFLSALSRNAADALIKTLHRAGLEPYLMDLKPLALARVVDKATAILVDVQPTEFDIVIMVDGFPELIRSLSLPPEVTSWQEKLPIIREEFERSVTFYNSSHLEKPLVADIPLLVLGELVGETESWQPLVGKQKYSVSSLPSPLECPEGFEPSRYMVNIGLALKELSVPGGLEGEVGGSIINLNALPEVYRPRVRPLSEVLVLPGIIIVVGLLAFMALLIQNVAAEADALRYQLDAANQLIGQTQVQRENIAELEKKLEAAEASRDSFTVTLDNFAQQRDIINGDLKKTTSTLPGTADLTGIEHSGDELVIEGVAPSAAEVVSYAKSLRASGRFSRIIVSMDKTEDGDMSFSLILTPK